MRGKSTLGHGAPFSGAEGKWGLDWKIESRVVGAFQGRRPGWGGWARLAGGGAETEGGPAARVGLGLGRLSGEGSECGADGAPLGGGGGGGRWSR